ncbi:MAG TPA: hypothetical protein VFB27_06385 [Opitutaceae bacterium]|nr:hypothetical protein [Opitutaceae bacterium]
MRFPSKLALILAAVGATMTIARADRTRDVIVYSYVTEAGQKLTPPTADHPATYLLIPGSYVEAGDKVAGEKTIAREKVDQFVRNALAAANYRGVNRKAMGIFHGELTGNFPKNYDPARDDSRDLDYIIVYHWGYQNPEVVDLGSDMSDESQAANRLVFNQAQMIALVAGASFDKLTPGFSDYNDVIQAANENRYLVVISAFSPAAYFNHQREKKLLWRAQMSLSSDGTTQEESMPALVSASVPYLGRATDMPQRVNESLDRPSQVIIGSPEVKEYLPSAAEPKGK